jgi:choline dehydrogenase-like flavoprotein
MHYNLIVVGTGFASSFFLKKFLEKSNANVRVLVLERGEFIPHQKRLQEARSRPLGKVSYVSGGNGGSTFKNNNPEKSWIFDPSFGGSSNCWTGCTPRFMPNDFELKTKYNVGEDWPLKYSDIESYYGETEEIMSISGPDKTPYPMSKKYPQPAHELSTVDKLLQREYDELYISQPTARSSISNKRNKCCTSAICHLCPVEAKFTIENGFKSSIYSDPRVEVIYQAQVIQLDTQNNVIRAVQYRNDNQDKKATADLFALGANAIFNAHILLNSGDTNIHTGRNLSEQVGYYGYFDLKDFQNVGGSSIITANGFMLYDGAHRSDRAACIVESHNDVFIRYEQGKWRNIAKFKFVFEDIPQAGNKVDKSPDPLIPQVTYVAHSDYVAKGYDYLKNNINKIFGALPIENVYLDDKYQPSEAHILGTTRMSKDASTGVIDPNLIHHQYRNLAVLGGSSFPTITPSNPTLTLAALSLRAADKLV